MGTIIIIVLAVAVFAPFVILTLIGIALFWVELFRTLRDIFWP